MAQVRSSSIKGVLVRNVNYDDIPYIVELQKKAFPHMASQGVIWKKEQLEEHVRIFPEGQFCAQYKGKVVGSASSLIVTLVPEYREHAWREACGSSMFSNHDPNGDTLYGADVSTDPDYRRLGIATKIYEARKKLAIRLNLRRIVAGGRLYNYCEYSDKMSVQEYVDKVLRGEMKDPVLCFQLRNGFKFIKILPNYLRDSRSQNYATFIEWKNPHYQLDNYKQKNMTNQSKPT